MFIRAPLFQFDKPGEKKFLVHFFPPIPEHGHESMEISVFVFIVVASIDYAAFGIC